MISRLARWYGVSVGDFLTVAFIITLLAATLAAWMLVDFGSPLRALVGAVGALALAVPPALSRHVRSRGLALVAATLVASLGVGTIFFAIYPNEVAAYGLGLLLAVSYRFREGAYTRALRNDEDRAPHRRAA